VFQAAPLARQRSFDPIAGNLPAVESEALNLFLYEVFRKPGYPLWFNRAPSVLSGLLSAPLIGGFAASRFITSGNGFY
jgi:hypothetical protein